MKCGEGGVSEAVLCWLILLAVQNEGSILTPAALPFSLCCTSQFQLCSCSLLGFCQVQRGWDAEAGRESPTRVPVRYG